MPGPLCLKPAAPPRPEEAASAQGTPVRLSEVLAGPLLLGGGGVCPGREAQGQEGRRGLFLS